MCTFVLDLEVSSFGAIHHEFEDAGEVVGVEVVGEEVTFDWIVELWEIVLSHQSIESFQTQEVFQVGT